jgi:hypothetical protein
MTKPQEPPHKVHPFYATPGRPQHKVDTRGMLSIVTMLVSLAALTLSMLGAMKFIRFAAWKPLAFISIASQRDTCMICQANHVRRKCAMSNGEEILPSFF